MLTLAVLGPVDLRRDGVAVPVPGGKTAELLVRLALEAGTPVRAERLLDDLWPDEVHGAAPNTLQSKVSRLRRAVGDAAVVQGGGAGYTLVVDPLDVDAVLVLRLAEQVAALRGSGDPAQVVETCDRALALFRGELLPGAGDAAWSHPYRLRLEEVRVGLVEDRLAARADQGSAGELVAELEDLVAAHPLRERLWALLVTDLYRAGRQGDALAACARVRRLLADELGIDPGPRLQRLEEQVLHQDPALAEVGTPSPVTGPGPAPGPGCRRRPHPATCPRPPGRCWVATATSSACTELLEQGSAGHADRPCRGREDAARARGGGAGIRPVAGPGSPGSTPPRTRTACGTASARRSAWTPPPAPRSPSGCTAPTCCSCSTAASTSWMPWPTSCARCSRPHPGCGCWPRASCRCGWAASRCSTSSRSPSPTRWRCSPNAPAAQRPYAADDDETRRTVEGVCRALDGLPLAIELAAARTRVLPVHEIARRLDDRFALLRDPVSPCRPDSPPCGPRSPGATTCSSPTTSAGCGRWPPSPVGLRCRRSSRVLGALGVPAESGLDVVSRLVDRSLAIADIAPRGPARYRLLDSVRDLARERLDEAGLGDVAAAAHARWFAQAADRAGTGVRGPEQPEHLDVARAERANIDAALAWCAAHDPDLGVRIVLGFGWAWVVLGTGVEGAHRVRAALDAATPTDAQRAAALTLCGWFEASGGNLERATADLEEAVRLGDEVGSDRGAAAPGLRAHPGRSPGARPWPCSLRAGPGWSASGWPGRRARAGCWPPGRTSPPATSPRPARPATGRSACSCRSVTTGRWRTPRGCSASWPRRSSGSTTREAHLARAAEAAGALGFEAAQAHHLLNLARAEERSGRSDTARGTLGRAIEIGQRCGDERTVAVARARLAVVLRDAGETGPALDLAQRAVQWFASAGGGDGAALADEVLASLAPRRHRRAGVRLTGARRGPPAVYQRAGRRLFITCT